MTTFRNLQDMKIIYWISQRSSSRKKCYFKSAQVCKRKKSYLPLQNVILIKVVNCGTRKVSSGGLFQLVAWGKCILGPQVLNNPVLENLKKGHKMTAVSTDQLAFWLR